MVIVYKSNTGFTKEYAEMLAKAEKMKLYTLDEAQGQEIQGIRCAHCCQSILADEPSYHHRIHKGIQLLE